MEKSTVIFIPSLSDGGAERVAVNLSNSLSLKGKKIILLTLKKIIILSMKYQIKLN